MAAQDLHQPNPPHVVLHHNYMREYIENGEQVTTLHKVEEKGSWWVDQVAAVTISKLHQRAHTHTQKRTIINPEGNEPQAW